MSLAAPPTIREPRHKSKWHIPMAHLLCRHRLFQCFFVGEERCSRLIFLILGKTLSKPSSSVPKNSNHSFFSESDSKCHSPFSDTASSIVNFISRTTFVSKAFFPPGSPKWGSKLHQKQLTPPPSQKKQLTLESHGCLESSAFWVPFWSGGYPVSILLIQQKCHFHAHYKTFQFRSFPRPENFESSTHLQSINPGLMILN